MLSENHVALIKLYSKPVDMRKSIDGLSIFVSEILQCDPGNGKLYVFYNRKLDKIKILYWSLNGFCLHYKRMDKRRFILPNQGDNILAISMSQLRWLLEGLDIRNIKIERDNTGKTYY